METMATSFQAFWGLSLLLSFYFIQPTSTHHVHIVYLGLNHDHDPLSTLQSHLQLLSIVFDSESDAKEAMVYSYKHSFSGFAANLNSTQAKTLSGMEGIISVFRSKDLRLHTTRSWDFMGLTLDPGEATTVQQLYGADIVVGIFDTGIWPESDSFQQDSHTGPIPSSWKGTCEEGEQFKRTSCNRKLVGARYYLQGFERDHGRLNTSTNPEYRSPRDRLGHGTHTASTAVGSVVKNASFFGFANGIARGGAPRARLAVYKVCWNLDGQGMCSEADVLAAFDDAIYDGVHVISASLGTPPPLMPFFASASDIGSFHAAQKDVAVIFSAGNDGPEPSLVQNVSPWSTCVGATSIDRTFPTELILGNSVSIVGESLILTSKKFQIVDGSQISTNGACDLGRLRRSKASGKMVLCFSTIGPVARSTAALAVLAANGSGLIYAEPMTRQMAEVEVIPTISVDMYQGTQILIYIQNSMAPTLQVNPSKTTIGHSPAPAVAYFSSRGPSSLSPNILKPDISGPGINILASWPPNLPPTLYPFDRRTVNWNLLSGTSMACPHLSGIVALLKSAHPDWTPAAIKSALMTTAYVRDTSLDNLLAGGTTKSINPFDVGSGHVSPLRAMDPGLVYDMETRDYILFLCSIGYDERQIKIMVLIPPGTDTSCPKHEQIDTNLNYPSITVSDLRKPMTVKRTLRNVGLARALYFASVVNPEGVQVVVWPTIMVFTKKMERVSYYVTLTPLKKSQGRYDFGEIIWFDGYHHVRSPLVVCVNNIGVVGDTPTHASA